MISPLRTYFKNVLCLVWLWTAVAGAVTVTGHIVLVGKEEHHGHSDATTVVWLSPQSGSPSDVTSYPQPRARMIQKGKHFEPHILAIEVGTSVDFPNLDPIFHNAFSNFDGQLFDIGLYPPGSSRSIRFHREGPVRVFCNIHPSMSAVIVVLATPYFTVTGRGGHFTIPNVPAGQYKLHFFHEQATPETLEALAQTITVSGPSTALNEIRISEAGYIPAPHKNKYGRDYPPDQPNIYR